MLRVLNTMLCTTLLYDMFVAHLHVCDVCGLGIHLCGFHIGVWRTATGELLKP
jgi:hypothetical protein